MSEARKKSADGQTPDSVKPPIFIPLSPESKIRVEGLLESKQLMWKTRWFRLCTDNVFLRYRGAELRGTTYISPSTIVTVVGDNEFKVEFTDPKHHYHLRAASSDLRDEWVQRLNALIQNFKQPSHSLPAPISQSVHIPAQLSSRCLDATQTEYTKSMALSAARRDKVHMKSVFDRHKDVQGGMSKAALLAALQDVNAPVLSSSEGASEDSLFSRADTNFSGAVDLNEYCLSI